MTKQEFYKNYVKPYLKKDDKPFNRQLFHETKDFLHRDNVISEKQCQNWVYPYNKYFLSKSELKRIKIQLSGGI